MIEIRNIIKNFGQVAAVQGISFHLNKGEVVGLVGHNGAGKTTTIRMLTGLLQPDQGEILRLDREGAQATEKFFKSRLGFVSDSPWFFENLTGHEMIDFMGSLYGLSPAITIERTKEIIRLFEMEEGMGRYVKTYSKGMKKKLAIIASLLPDPLYWILDEPSESLDPVGVRVLKDLVHQRREQSTILISSHQLDWLERIVDRVIVLQEGKIAFSGTREDIQRLAGEHATLEDIYLKLYESPGGARITSFPTKNAR